MIGTKLKRVIIRFAYGGLMRITSLKVAFCVSVVGFILGCSSNRVTNLETKLDHEQSVAGGQSVGVKDGKMVAIDKSAMNERLRDLENEVHGLEDKVYGSRKLDSKGIYGDLRSCRTKLASRQYGGSGTLIWTEPLDRMTESEDEWKIGLDESGKLVAVQEEYLKERVSRFRNYLKVLEKREDELSHSLEQCRSTLKDKELDPSQGKKVSVSEIDKLSTSSDELNKFMCQYVKKGASLKTLLMTTFGLGWQSLAEYEPQRKILSANIEDDMGEERSNGMRLGGWRLAYDDGKVTMVDLLSDNGDAKLVAWAGKAKCLARDNGNWN